MFEEPTMDEVRSYFDQEEWNNLSDYEKKRYLNILHSYKVMLELDEDAPEPHFVTRKRLNDAMNAKKEDASKPKKPASTVEQKVSNKVQREISKKVSETAYNSDDSSDLIHLAIEDAPEPNFVTRKRLKDAMNSKEEDTAMPKKPESTIELRETQKVSNKDQREISKKVNQTEYNSDDFSDLSDLLIHLAIEDAPEPNFVARKRLKDAMNAKKEDASTPMKPESKVEPRKTKKVLNKVQREISKKVTETEYNADDFSDDDLEINKTGKLFSDEEIVIAVRVRNIIGAITRAIEAEVEMEKPTNMKKIVEPDVDMDGDFKKPSAPAPRRNPRRNVAPVNYKEPDSLDMDSYIFCDICQREWFEGCPDHRLVRVMDSQMVSNSGDKTRAERTVPKELAVHKSMIPGAGRGVWSLRVIPPGVMFGPYEGVKLKKDGQNWLCVDGHDESKSNWMRYVNCARHSTERNLVAFQYRGEMYYRSIQKIPPYMEMLVFYGPRYGKALGISLDQFNSPSRPLLQRNVFPCEKCDMIYSSPLFLEKHKQVCRGRFLKDSIRSKDKKGRLKEKTFPCWSCKLAFSSAGSLKAHIKTCPKRKLERSGDDDKENCDKEIEESGKSTVAFSGAQNEDMWSGVETTSLVKQDQNLLKGNKDYSSEVEAASPIREKGNTMNKHNGTVFVCDNCKLSFTNSNYLTYHMNKRCRKRKKGGVALMCSDDKSGDEHKQNSFEEVLESGVEATSIFNEKDTLIKENNGVVIPCQPDMIASMDLDRLTKHEKSDLGRSSPVKNKEKDGKDHNKNPGVEAGSPLEENEAGKIGVEDVEENKPEKCATEVNECCDIGAVPVDIEDHAQEDAKAGAEVTPLVEVEENSSEKSNDDWNGATSRSQDFKNMDSQEQDDLMARRKRPYACNICRFTSSNISFLEKHVSVVHYTENPYACYRCPYTTKRAYDLRKHLRFFHEGERPYTCNECEYGTSRVSDLRTHIMMHHNVKNPFTCQQCPYTSFRTVDFRNHVKFEHGLDIPYSCSECQYTSSRLKEFKKHLIFIHDTERTFSCDCCLYKFTRAKDLRRHVKCVHSGEYTRKDTGKLLKKFYPCNQCQFTCTEASGLRKHVKYVHAKNYPCSQCGHIFGSSSNLQRHVRIVHNGEKPHACNRCEYTCGEASQLKKHITCVHEGVRYACGQCEFSCTSSSYLRRHVKAIHS